MNKTFTGTNEVGPAIKLTVRVTDKKITFQDVSYDGVLKTYTFSLKDVEAPDYSTGKDNGGTPYEDIWFVGKYHSWAGKCEELYFHLWVNSPTLSVWASFYPKSKSASGLEVQTALLKLDYNSEQDLRRWLDVLAGRTLC